MRRVGEKVALIAQICITLVFVVTTWITFGALPDNYVAYNNGMINTLTVILSVIYALLSVYLIYVNFAERESLRQILLYSDSESATHTDPKVIKNIVRSCARKVNGIRIKRAQMRSDEKHGFVLTLKIDVNAHYVSQEIDKLRCLIADSFKNTLGLSFNSINFEIRRLKTRYKPDVAKAEKLAKTLTEQRELSADIYEQPFRDDACPNDKPQPTDADAVKQDVADIRSELTANGDADNPTANDEN